jgi:hypothetical protein
MIHIHQQYRVVGKKIFYIIWSKPLSFKRWDFKENKGGSEVWFSKKLNKMKGGILEKMNEEVEFGFQKVEQDQRC